MGTQAKWPKDSTKGPMAPWSDENGEALRDDNSGQQITVRLEPGRDAVAVPKCMPLRRYREENRDEMASFHTQPLRYPSRCWA